MNLHIAENFHRAPISWQNLSRSSWLKVLAFVNLATFTIVDFSWQILLGDYSRVGTWNSRILSQQEIRFLSELMTVLHPSAYWWRKQWVTMTWRAAVFTSATISDVFSGSKVYYLPTVYWDFFRRSFVVKKLHYFESVNVFWSFQKGFQNGNVSLIVSPCLHLMKTSSRLYWEIISEEKWYFQSFCDLLYYYFFNVRVFFGMDKSIW